MSTMAAQREGFPDAALKAVVLYDGAGLAARATALLERSAARAGDDMKWDVKSWPMDVLKQPSLAAVTLAVAADADLILLALDEVHPPPPEVWNWLDRWGASRRHPDAAVMSLGLAGRIGQRWRGKLARFAKQRGLAFLGGRKMESENGPTAVLRRHPRRRPMGAPALPGFVELLPVASHWGIND